jgi:hypothetical protein
MKMKKSIIAILATAVMILSFLGPIMFAQKAYGILADPTSYYMTENGVLGTDSYVLYPYMANSTKLGFSQFGELIDSNTNVGLEYAGARDPWAEPVGSGLDNSILPKNVWINGWMLSVTYNNSLNGETTVWASAMFGDLASFGGQWLNIKAPYSCTYEYQESFRYPGYAIDPVTGVVTGTALLNGGRKTNASAITDPIRVIYNGPRRFIANLTTHIWDINQNTGTPMLALVDVVFTIDFNKVSKQVVVFKEVKAIPHPKYEISPLEVYIQSDPLGAATPISIDAGMLCQFSDREEWDLGTKTYGGTPPYSSYVHFWAGDTDKPSTDYNNMYTVLPTLPAYTHVSEYDNASKDLPVNKYGSAPTSSGYYDYAQIISNDLKYVGYAAFWPELSDWSADAGGGRRDLWYRPLSANDPHDIDAFNGVEPFLAPLTVGEWDFMLSVTHSVQSGITADQQFRAIAVYGVTDLNNGDDANIVGMHTNTPDREAMYWLTSVFRPQDLYDVSEKQSARWVDKYAADGETYYYYLKYSDQYPDKIYQDETNWPYVYYNDFWYTDWYGYNTNAERVLINNTLQVRDTDYYVDYDESGLVYIDFNKAPPDGSEVKILFSTYYEDSDYGGAWEWLTVGRDSAAIDSAGSAMVSDYVTWYEGAELRNSGLDMKDTKFGPDAPSILSPQRSTLLPDRTGYRDANIAPNAGRLALKDDWSCHVNIDTGNEMQGLPISSSNIITVGGPAANAVTEYTNDFTDAFATLGIWTGAGGTAGVIYSASCWSKNSYVPQYDESNKQTVGYGLISTFQDLNGTTFLVVYGYTGQDTYYTCWALTHSDVLALARWTMPEGVTTLVLQFNYTLHPTDYCFVTISEALGTISEYNWQGFFLNDGPSITPLQGPIPFPDWPDYPIWVTDKYPAIHVDP